jgi:hypothetical protein
MKNFNLNSACYLIIISIVLFYGCILKEKKPRVIITTDINNVGGDPEDKQSLVHVLWYADELEVVGIIPDYWSGKGYEASMEVLETYKKDYNDFNFKVKGYPDPSSVEEMFVQDSQSASEMIIKEANTSDEPLYILIWGQMTTFQKALFQSPEIKDKVRILTIATGVKYGPADEQVGEKCDVVNWNGRGRNEIYNDPRFKDLWWLESNWTYNGMFMGDGPKDMFKKLSNYGSMGAFIKTATKGHDWAQYFRVGDTPTVLYLIDPSNELDNPALGSWAGKFKQPFPDDRPNYWTDDNGNINWDYEDPCNSWENVVEMYAYNKSTLFDRRQKMYEQLLKKLDRLYKK